jgi:hypothetical protein
VDGEVHHAAILRSKCPMRCEKFIARLQSQPSESRSYLLTGSRGLGGPFLELWTRISHASNRCVLQKNDRWLRSAPAALMGKSPWKRRSEDQLSFASSARVCESLQRGLSLIVPPLVHSAAFSPLVLPVLVQPVRHLGAVERYALKSWLGLQPNSHSLLPSLLSTLELRPFLIRGVRDPATLVPNLILEALMRSSRTLVGLCVLILLVFAVFFSCSGSSVVYHARSLALSVTQPAGVTTLLADGGGPIPSPMPIPSPWFAAAA